MAETLFNFSNGTMNILCSNCSKVVKTAKDFTDRDWKILSNELIESTYCKECEDIVFELETKSDTTKKSDLDILKEILPYMNENPEFKENIIDIVSKKMFNDLNLKK